MSCFCLVQVARCDEQLKGQNSALVVQELTITKMAVRNVMGQLEEAMQSGELDQEFYHQSMQKAYKLDVAGLVLCQLFDIDACPFVAPH